MHFKLSNILRLFGSLLLIPIGYLQGQSLDKTVISNGGQTLGNNDIQLNFTVGEPITGTISENATYTLNQGFWTGQLLLPSPEELPEKGAIILFPIPVKDQLTIVSNGNLIMGLQLFAMNGELVTTLSLAPSEATYQIPMEQLPEGTYVLQLFMVDTDNRSSFMILKE